jgi:activator of 2-hydroxyglutaryl-CoA dehydratase
MADGIEVADIVAGIHDSIASRIMSLVYRVGLEEDLTITGGVAKNIGVVAYLEKKMGITSKKLPIDPQLMGALGAALIAIEKSQSK